MMNPMTGVVSAVGSVLIAGIAGMQGVSTSSPAPVNAGFVHVQSNSQSGEGKSVGDHVRNADYAAKSAVGGGQVTAINAVKSNNADVYDIHVVYKGQTYDVKVNSTNNSVVSKAPIR